MDLPTTLATILIIASTSQPTAETPQLPHVTVQATTVTQPSNNNKQTAVQHKHQTIIPKNQKVSKGKQPCNQPRSNNH